jgi:hypothetical protein
MAALRRELDIAGLRRTVTELLRPASYRCGRNEPKVGGAGNRIRTYDPRITNALLYQLSYPGAGAANSIGWDSRRHLAGATVLG